MDRDLALSGSIANNGGDSHQGQSVFALANFSEQEQRVDARRLRMLRLRRTMVDMVAGRAVTATPELIRGPYQQMALARST